MFILLPGDMSEKSLEKLQKFRAGDKENLFSVQEVDAPQSHLPAPDSPFLQEFGRKMKFVNAKPCKLQSGSDSPKEGCRAGS